MMKVTTASVGTGYPTDFLTFTRPDVNTANSKCYSIGKCLYRFVCVSELRWLLSHDSSRSPLTTHCAWFQLATCIKAYVPSTCLVIPHTDRMCQCSYKPRTEEMRGR